jgi:fucose permease
MNSKQPTVGPPSARTFAYSIAFLASGLCAATLGPSLSTFAAQTGSTLSALSAIFVTNSIGRMAGLLGLAGAMLSLGTTSSLLVLLVLLFLFGVAQNLVDVGANTMVAWLHGAKVGPYVSALHLAFATGSLFAPLLIGASIGQTHGVARAYAILSIALIPIAIMMALLPSPKHQRTDSFGESLPLATNRIMLLLGGFFLFFVGTEVTIAAWVFQLGAAIGLAPETGAAWLNSTFWLTYALGRIATIVLTMRVPPRLLLRMCIVTTVLSLGALLFGLLSGASGSSPIVWISIGVCGLVMAAGFPSAFTLLSANIQMNGAVTGMLFAANNAGAMLLPWLVGQMFESRGPFVMPVIAISALVLALILLERLLPLLGGNLRNRAKA